MHRNLLASGGGTADRTIKFWNAHTGAMFHSVDTGSGVCVIMEPAPQRNSIVSRFFPESIMPLALPVDDQTLRADGPYGSGVAFSPVAGRRDGGVRGGGRDAEVLVHLRGRADVGGAAQGPDAGHALVVGGGGCRP